MTDQISKDDIKEVVASALHMAYQQNIFVEDKKEIFQRLTGLETKVEGLHSLVEKYFATLPCTANAEAIKSNAGKIQENSLKIEKSKYTQFMSVMAIIMSFVTVVGTVYSALKT